MQRSPVGRESARKSQVMHSRRSRKALRFCPSVFLYISSVVPSMWLINLDIVEKIKSYESYISISKNFDLSNLTANEHLQHVEEAISTQDWFSMLNGQFLMLTLIIGRWMLPKGDLTRDQLSQLLLAYIGAVADIVEFVDSFDEDKIIENPVIINWILGVWTWCLIQFTIVLTDTKSETLQSTGIVKEKIQTKTSCCSIEVWGIILNIILQAHFS
ncbi:PREDICTED: transmembrane protein 26-like [Wasmannia auropunctata]|uniref:transmembrane protein 26-like n=1 Tax=Wasmannia auropunctata TaxID=64793 RepID=UPI0005EDB3CF|nr:PREDICTED: transmembrane protein 26-like [Wasmannia auropunctata]